MSGKIATRIVRQQMLKKGGTTPEYIDVPIPTETIRLRFGPGRGTATRGVGSGWLMGSRTLLGSPNEFTYQLTKMRLVTSTPNMFFAITHSRQTGGTVDTPYLPSRGDDLTVASIQEPILSLPPGTLRVYALGPGSSLGLGKGSAARYQGYGSSALSAAVGFAAELYAL